MLTLMRRIITRQPHGYTLEVVISYRGQMSKLCLSWKQNFHIGDSTMLPFQKHISSLNTVRLLKCFGDVKYLASQTH